MYSDTKSLASAAPREEVSHMPSQCSFPKPAGRLFTALLVICLATMLSAPDSAIGQVLYGTLVGNVTDASESAIPGADVKIANLGTGQEWNITTNAGGVYSISTIAPGEYQITVSSEGFRTLRTSGVVVNANTTVRSDSTLQVGAVTETVEVSAQALALQTDTADIRDNIESEQLQNIPIPFNRNFQSLLATMPGFTPPTNGGVSPAVNPSLSLSTHVNGTTRAGTSFRIDGAVTRNQWFPWNADYIPPLEAIEVVNVVTGSYDAEQGFAGGATVNVQLKSGTNEVHGSGFWFHNNQNLKARPYFLPDTRDQNKRILNQFGGTIGGPIIKNKLFYFASYEGTTERESVFVIGSVPTPAMKAGDFSDSGTLIHDPATGGARGRDREPFTNNFIPASRRSSIIQKLVDLTPDPNLNAASRNNNFANGPFLLDRQRIDAKFTYNATDKLNLSARVGLMPWNAFTPPRFEQLEGWRMGRGDLPGDSDGTVQNYTFSGVYTFTPNLVLDAYFGLNLNDAHRRSMRLDEDLGRDFLGIPGTNGPTRDYGGWPRFTTSSYDDLGRARTFAPSSDTSSSYQVVANLAWLKGNHDLRLGFDSLRSVLRLSEPLGHPGEFFFTPGVTGAAGKGTSNFNSYASFLLGLPQRTNTWRIHRKPSGVMPAYSLYVRDRWQATQRLTVSMGVRWNYFPVPYRETGEGFSIYNPNTDELRLCGFGSLPKNCGFDMGTSFLAPRLGLAYRATDTFVIRAGYGISWDPTPVARNVIGSFPNRTITTIRGSSSFDAAFPIAQGLPDVAAPDLGDGTVILPLNLSVNTIDPNYRRGYVQSWNLMLEKDLGQGWIGEAGYVATRTINMNGQWNQNYSFIGGGNASRVLNQRFGRTGNLNLTTTNGWNAKYDSLQANVKKRFSQGYMARFAYTWSKTFWPAGRGGDNGLNAGNRHPNPLYWDLVRNTLADSDRPHNFNASFAAELPFGEGKRWAQDGFASKLLGGWQINGLLSAFSGTPLTVTASRASLNAPGQFQIADQIKPEVEIFGDRNSWFDPLAYARVTEARFGNSGWNQIRGPGVVNLDAGVFRTFAFTERVGLQFRVEVFNLSNTPHFGAPGLNVNSLRLNSDGTVRRLNGFTQITRIQNTGRWGIDERAFRFGLRLSF